MNILEETDDKCIIWANYVHNIEMIKKEIKGDLWRRRSGFNIRKRFC